MGTRIEKVREALKPYRCELIVGKKKEHRLPYNVSRWIDVPGEGSRLELKCFASLAEVRAFIAKLRKYEKVKP